MKYPLVISTLIIFIFSSCRHSFLYCNQLDSPIHNSEICEFISVKSNDITMQLSDRLVFGDFYAAFRKDSSEKKVSYYHSEMLAYPLAGFSLESDLSTKRQLTAIIECPNVENLKISSQIPFEKLHDDSGNLKLIFGEVDSLNVMFEIDSKLKVSSIVFFQDRQFAVNKLDKSMHHLIDFFVWSFFVEINEDDETYELSRSQNHPKKIFPKK